MKNFKDLIFEDKQFGGVGAHFIFDNGVEISVQAGEFPYCSPRVKGLHYNEYTSFEVALFFEDGEFATKVILGKGDDEDDVVGWASPEYIDEIMEKAQTYKK
tara:strand:- start:359 stop:664 length:306 start_codon:yes stop_codon:yes gene_type:complete